MTKKQAQKQPTLPAAPDPAQSAREPKTRQNKRLVKQRAQSLDPSQSSKAVPKAVNPAKTDTVDIDEIFKTAKKRLQPATVDKV